MSSKLSEPNHPARYARLCAILSTLEKFLFKSMLDVGGAEGYLSYLVTRLFNAWTVTSDLSFEANCRAAELFDVPGVVLQSADLPFESNSFDIVTSIETLEHVEYPIETLVELYRVAKKCVIITTEALCETEKEQFDKLASRRYSYHFDRNWFLVEDFKSLFPNLLSIDFPWMSHYLSERMGNPPDNTLWMPKVLVIPKRNAPAGEFSIQQAGQFLDYLLDQKFVENLDVDISNRQTSAELLRLIRCPNCNSDLEFLTDGLLCQECGEAFAVKSGIPVLLCENRMYTNGDLIRRLSRDKYRKEFVSKAVELRKKFDFCLNIDERRRWRFGSTEVPWSPLEDAKLVRIVSEFAEFEVTGDDPQLLSPILALDLSSVSSIRIAYSVSGCEWTIGQVFWTTEHELLEFRESNSARFKVEGEGFKDYVVPLQGKIPRSKFCRLRFDPTQCPGKLRIGDIELLLKEESQLRLS